MTDNINPEARAILDPIMLPLEDFINEPQRGRDETPEVRDYRHAAYCVWSAARDAIIAAFSQQEAPATKAQGVEGVYQRQAREVMNPQSGSIAAQPASPSPDPLLSEGEVERHIEAAAEYVLENSRRGNASLNEHQYDADTAALMKAYRDIIGKAVASGHLAALHRPTQGDGR